ncbi:MAG: hypothetical protein IPP40_15430 [bacterium]|nr:hypothetical protein [bacterium]
MPIVVAVTTQGILHRLQVIRRTNNTWSATVIAEVSEYFSLPCGLSHSTFTGSRIVLASSGMVQIVTSETGYACPGFPEPYSIPIVCFFESGDNYNVYPLWDAEGFSWPSSIRANSYSPDSLHLWVMSYQYFNTRLAVSRDGSHSVITSYDCQYGELAGIRTGEDSFIQASAAFRCTPPCIAFYQFTGEGCSELSVVYCNQDPTSASVYESHGFVIPTFDYEHVELVRVDIEANLASPIGTIGWRDGTDHINIEHASAVSLRKD